MVLRILGQKKMEWLELVMDLKDLQSRIFNLKKKKIPPHPLTNFKIQKHYQNESKLNGVYSRDNLLKKIKDGTCVINLDKYYDTGTDWIALYALNNNVTYFLTVLV